MAFNEQESAILRWSAENGKTGEEARQAIIRYRLTGSPAPEQVAQPTKAEPTLTQRVTQDIEKAGVGVQEAISGEGRFAGHTPVRRGFEATAEAFNVIPQVAVEALPQKARAGLGVVGEKIGGAVSWLAEKIGSTETARKLVTEHPKLASAIEEVAGTTSAAGQIAGDVLAVQGIKAGVQKTTEGGVRVATGVAEKTRAALGGITETGARGIKTATNRALDPANIMQRVARISKGKQANFEQLAGESVGRYLVRRGIFGDIDKISEQLYKRFIQSKTSVDTAYARLPGQFRVTSVGNALKQLLARERRISSPGALSKDMERITALSKKHSGGGLTMSEINEVKRLFERNIKLDFVKENLPEKVAQANNIDNAIRVWQRSKASELGFTNVKALNRETQLAKQLLDDLGREYAGAAGNNAITLTDWVILAGGSPQAVTGFLAKRALSSRAVMSRVAEKLAGPERVGLPTAQFTAPSIDGYLRFIQRLETQ